MLQPLFPEILTGKKVNMVSLNDEKNDFYQIKVFDIFLYMDLSGRKPDFVTCIQ